MSQGADSVKSIIYALAANLFIAISKLVAAIITGASSMMAESIHSFADTANQVLLLYGLKKSKQPSSLEHPLGYGKTIYFWSFIVAIMLFSMGGLFSIYEGWHKLHAPEPINSPMIAIGVLVAAIIAEGFSLLGCIREINKERRGRGFYQWFKETRQSELLVVFGEDIAALLGLVFALAALSLAIITGNPAWDALGSIVIGVLLITIAFFIGKEVKALLIGQGVEPSVHQQMVSFLEQQPQVAKVYNLLSMQMGDNIMIAIKANMTEVETADDLVKAINDVEAAFKQQFTGVAWLFFEPDNND